MISPRVRSGVATLRATGVERVTARWNCSACRGDWTLGVSRVEGPRVVLHGGCTAGDRPQLRGMLHSEAISRSNSCPISSPHLQEAQVSRAVTDVAGGWLTIPGCVRRWARDARAWARRDPAASAEATDAAAGRGHRHARRRASDARTPVRAARGSTPIACDPRCVTSRSTRCCWRFRAFRSRTATIPRRTHASPSAASARGPRSGCAASASCATAFRSRCRMARRRSTISTSSRSGSIEVIRGSAGSLYGNAAGGVVEVRTEDPPSDAIAGRVTGYGGSLWTQALGGCRRRDGRCGSLPGRSLPNRTGRVPSVRPATVDEWERARAAVGGCGRARADVHGLRHAHGGESGRAHEGGDGQRIRVRRIRRRSGSARGRRSSSRSSD